MKSLSGTRPRRASARPRSGVGVAPLLLVAGLLAILAAIPWLLSLSARNPLPDVAAVPRGSQVCSTEPGAKGPSYFTRRSEVGDEHARLVKERRAGCDEGGRSHRLAPSRRAPTQPERWLGQEPAACGQAGGPKPVTDTSSSFEVANKSRRADIPNDAHRSSLEGDVHAPRGPPSNPFV